MPHARIPVMPRRHDGDWRAKCTVPLCGYIAYTDTRDEAEIKADDHGMHYRHYTVVQGKVNGKW